MDGCKTPQVRCRRKNGLIPQHHKVFFWHRDSAAAFIKDAYLLCNSLNTCKDDVAVIGEPTAPCCAKFDVGRQIADLATFCQGQDEHISATAYGIAPGARDVGQARSIGRPCDGTGLTSEPRNLANHAAACCNNADLPVKPVGVIRPGRVIKS